MTELSLFDYHFWKPFLSFGIESPLGYINSHTIIYTWIVLAVLAIALFVGRIFLTRKNSLVRFVFLQIVRNLREMTTQTLGMFHAGHFAFITTLFVFIFLCNTISLIPGVEEPTQDLNTTLALGLISFFYIQAYTIKTHGFVEYVKDYFRPIFIMFPLNVIGNLATIISMSFRLFGNIFGGTIIAGIYHNAIAGSVVYETIGLLSGINLLLTVFFGLFEGFIQAFVFSVLSLTYLAMAIHTDTDTNNQETSS